MKTITIQDQLNAIQKHANRNNLHLVSWEISQDQTVVYGNLCDNCFITIFQLMKKDYANMILDVPFKSYTSIL